jgi:uncharacterized protein YbjQ (UPF0145 family)
MGIHRSMFAIPEWCVVVTTDNLPGYEIRDVFGQVMGVVVRTQNPYSEGVKALDGGLNPRRVKVNTAWREDAIKSMIEQAKRRGGNAIIGMRFDHRIITEFWTEICAYGTAVLAVPMHPPDELADSPGVLEGAGPRG